MLKGFIKKLIALAAKNTAVSIVTCTAVVGAAVTGGVMIHNNNNKVNETAQVQVQVESTDNTSNDDSVEEILPEENIETIEENLENEEASNESAGVQSSNSVTTTNNKKSNSTTKKTGTTNNNTSNNTSNNTTNNNTNTSQNSGSNNIASEEVKNETTNTKPIIIKEAGLDLELTSKATKMMNNTSEYGIQKERFRKTSYGQEIIIAQDNYFLYDTPFPQNIIDGIIDNNGCELKYRREKRVTRVLKADCTDEELQSEVSSAFFESRFSFLQPQYCRNVRVDHDGKGNIIVTLINIEYGFSPYQ